MERINVSTLACFAWWIVLGLLLGWLASWWFSRPLKRAAADAIERADRLEAAAARPPVPVPVPVPQPPATAPANGVDHAAYRKRIAVLEDEIAALRAQGTAPAAASVAAAGVAAAAPHPTEVPAPLDAGIAELIQTVDTQRGEIAGHSDTLRERVARVAALGAELQQREGRIAAPAPPVPGPDIDTLAARAAGFAVRGADDLEIVEGIGPKIAELLRASGVTTFAELARTPRDRLRQILDGAGPHYRIADPSTWSEQAALASMNHWAELKALQDVLTAGKR